MSEWGPKEDSGLLPQISDVIGGKYRLVKKIGAGGMGAVYESVHVEIGSRAAVKFLNPRYFDNPEAVSRFQREARAAAAIGHDAIIGIHDIGRTSQGLPYLIMELLQGQSLGEVLNMQGRLDVRLTSYVLCQVLSGLFVAHQAQIVHRDLKPDNIFLVETGALVPGVKILDFGISKIMGHGSIGPGAESSLTQTGTVLGTPEYMSPEQARGEDDIDHRADIFALGVILYECLTGRVPFTGNNYNAVMVRIIQDDPLPPSQITADIPPELEAVALKALAKSREDRYQNAIDMFNDVIGFVEDRAVGRISLPTAIQAPAFELPDPSADDLDDSQTTVMMSGEAPTDLSWESGERTLKSARTRRHLKILAVVGATVILVGGLGVFVATKLDPSPPAAEVPAETGQVEQIVADASLAISPTEAEPRDDGQTHAKMVTIDLRGVPSGATILLDDRPVEGSPLVVPHGTDVRRIRVESEGHYPLDLELVPSEDRTIEITLEPVEEARDGKTPGRWRPPNKRQPRGERQKQPQGYRGPEYFD